MQPSSAAAAVEKRHVLSLGPGAGRAGRGRRWLVIAWFPLGLVDCRVPGSSGLGRAPPAPQTPHLQRASERPPAAAPSQTQRRTRDPHVALGHKDLHAVVLLLCYAAAHHVQAAAQRRGARAAAHGGHGGGLGEGRWRGQAGGWLASGAARGKRMRWAGIAAAPRQHTSAAALSRPALSHRLPPPRAQVQPLAVGQPLLAVAAAHDVQVVPQHAAAAVAAHAWHVGACGRGGRGRRGEGEQAASCPALAAAGCWISGLMCLQATSARRRRRGRRRRPRRVPVCHALTPGA